MKEDWYSFDGLCRDHHSLVDQLVIRISKPKPSHEHKPWMNWQCWITVSPVESAPFRVLGESHDDVWNRSWWMVHRLLEMEDLTPLEIGGSPACLPYPVWEFIADDDFVPDELLKD